MRTFARHPAGVGEGMTERFIALVDDRRIRVLEAGDAPGPLVVFIAGAGGPASMWLPVQREIARHARTVSYDRPWLGGSDRDRAPRTLHRMTQELLDLIDAVDPAAHDLVLVGASLGGCIARDLAGRIPDRIKAIVLVDTGSSAVLEMVPAKSTRRKLTSSLTRVVASRPFRPLLSRLITKAAVRSQPTMSGADRAVFARDMAHGLLGVVKESNSTEPQNLRMLREVESRGIKPHIALTVIKAGKSITDGERPDIDDRHTEVMTQLAHDHPVARYVVAEGSGHNITAEDPQLVIAEVSRVLAP